MKPHMLGICWVQDVFYAVHLHKGKHLGTWTADRPVTDLNDFNYALADACKSLHFERGGDVSIVYESSQLAHPFVQTPPMNARDMHAFLERRVQREKPFPEDAAWSYTRTVASREGEGVLLHLLPVHFRDALIRICQEFYLYPVKLLPLSEAMAVHARDLPVGDDVTLLVVALFANQAEILAVRGDGSVLFMRDLGYGWFGNEGRIDMEIDRSLLYVKQRFPHEVSQIWVTGLQSESATQQLESVLHIPVSASEGENETFDWASVIGNLGSHSFSNLIPRHILKKRIQKKIVRVSAALMVLLVAASILTVWQVERMVSREGIKAASVETQFDSMQKEYQLMQNKVEVQSKLRQRLENIAKASSHATAPLWITHYLADILPSQLVLAQEQVHWNDQALPAKHELVFEIRGFGQPDAILPVLFKAFQAALVAPPLNAHITQGWRVHWLRQIQHGGTKGKPVTDFIIKGVVQ